ncbi:preoptic area regulatory factor 2 [Salpingoeca rosetta]|uniref:Preoptic area regulatory factor 2 n=1 Tax=Salpingoeca rosetta (strain ATCC 50818 / BSB-021) TaxID=946362 RepID=F2TWE2_SALR5|nr:preoptic area regulatory factor 2 [Salpingoeca rosetta]EGD72388.1 preoptic area regulatory factor 2 [Salpingoeca rosetta]|eukprot:XP_004998957.1 preoptic area regulatory factor 2 [Salpingoeca rosetta]
MESDKPHSWVEIIEPSSGRKVYANTTSGECLWKPPAGASFKPCSEDQWWELKDANSGRAYYYNATTKVTVWDRPQHGDIVPLAKLQETQRQIVEKEEGQSRRGTATGQEAQTQAQQAQHVQQQAAPTTASRRSSQGPPVAAKRKSQIIMQAQQPNTQQQHQPGGAQPPKPPKPPAMDYSEVASSSPDLKTFKHNLATHKKGLFRRKVSLHNMLSWSPSAIPRPMLLTLKKEHKRQALEMFKLSQMYMGDRNAKGRTPYAVAKEIMSMCWDESDARLRDEFFVQLCKQTTGNTKLDSCERGWELMGIALNFFPPTTKFFTYLKGYIARHIEDQPGDIGVLSEACFKRLIRIAKTGRKQGAQQPSEDDIENAARKLRNPSVFGSSLDEIMALQYETHPELSIPRVLQVLSNAVLELGGTHTEGIFRVPGDIDAVNALKLQMDRGQAPSNLHDPHVPASTLKLWFRELTDPIVPEDLYDECVAASQDSAKAVAVVDKLPSVNKNIVLFITRFLQLVGRPENHAHTKMTYDNLAMVWAPNFLRCPSDDPLVIFNNTKKEMQFVRQLVLHLNTDSVEHLFTASC